LPQTLTAREHRARAMKSEKSELVSLFNERFAEASAGGVILNGRA